jgi:hypothetical protein
MFRDRFPKGRAVFIVLLINALESFAIFGAFDGLQERIMGHSDRRHLTYLFLFFQWCGGRIFYPIAGLIADTWLGRYKTIKVGLWLMWLGFVVITVNESLVYRFGNEDRNHTVEQYVLPILAVVFLIISSATVEANIIPFGADQIQQGASSSEMSSYFYYYLCSRTAGLLIGLILFLLLFCTGIKLYPDFNTWSENLYTPHTLHTIHPLFAVVSITVALILHFCTSQHYFKDKDHSNPLRLIINVLYYAATVKRQPPRYRRAFRYGEERKSRIELAKREYDGIFTSEEVEDVKTFLRICWIIFSLSGIFLTFGMVIQCNNNNNIILLHVQCRPQAPLYDFPYPSLYMMQGGAWGLILFLVISFAFLVCIKLQSWNILQDELSAASKSTSIPFLKSGLLSSELFTLLYHTVSLVSTLTMNHLIIPLFPGFRMKLKIGAGVVFSALSPITALVIQLVVTGNDFSCSEAGFSCHQPVKLLWIIVPVVFLSIGLMHIFTAGMAVVAYCDLIGLAI